MKATINLSSGFFSKNGTPFADLNYTDETEYNQLATYFLNIGELEKTVNIDDFQKAYWRSDTEQKHPIYYMPYDETVKFDLKDQEVTPFIIDNTSTLHKLGTSISEGASFNIGRGVKTNGEYDNTSALNMYSNTYNPENTINNLYPDYYGVRRCYGRYNNEYRPYMVDSLDTCMSMIKPLQSTMETYFTGYNGSGIKCYLDDVKDKVIAPAFRSALSTGVVGDDERLIAYDMTYTEELINFFPATAVDSGTYNFPDGHYGAGEYRKSNIFDQMSLRKADNEQWTTVYQLPGFGIKNDILYYDKVTNNYSFRTPVIILKDSSDDYWFLYLSGIESYISSVSETQNTMGSNAPVVVLLPIKELPKLSTASNRAVNRSDVSSYIIDELDGDEEYYKLLMKRAFNPQSGPSYDDGGADIVGEGEDPYEDISNIDGVVGGKPNTTIVIEQDEGTFNTGGSLFRQLSSAYGAYAFSDGNGLYQYTRTLKLIYDDWEDPLYDPLIKSFADRISNNTINILRLPYKVRLSDDANPETTRTAYAIGNTGIATNNATFLEWATGKGFATADLITQEIHTATVDLGIIEHFYDNFLDFAPYSSASLYIPYIGTVSIPINLIQSTSDKQKHLRLLFRMNNTTGDMVVLLQVDGATYKQWSGNCATPIQIHVDDLSGVMREGFNQAVGIVGNVATGMISAGTSIGGAINKSVSKLTRQSQVNKAIAHINAQHEGLIDPYQTPDSAYNKQTKTATTSNVPQKSAPSSFSTSSIPTIPNSSPVVGSVSIGNSPVSGTVGTLSPQEIILTIERPIMWRPDKYGEIVGYPTKKIAKLGSIKGFATVSNLHLRCSATSAEKSEIEEMLGAGVIF